MTTQPAKKKAPVIPLAIGAFAVVLVIGLIIALSGGDDDGDDGIDSGADSPAVTGGGDEDDGDSGASDGVFGEVEVLVDRTLPSFAPGATDPAVGEAAPELLGQGLDGSRTEIGPGEPTILVFLAHWCPHCQAELPLLVEEAEAGAFDGVRMVAVLTGTNPDAPNFPPGEWLEREGWTGDVLLDDRSSSAAQFYGLSSYPYLVAVDADGNVAARTSGERNADELAALADAARGD